jgi:polyisoprenoid-binding protein YceI
VGRAVWLPIVLSALPGLYVLPGHAIERYRLDADNTQLSISVLLFGARWVSARFADLSGEFVPEQREAASYVNFIVQTRSLACENAWWRARLLSSEWFDARQYPQISYHSEQVRLDGASGAIIEGELSLHGHTRNVSLIVERWRCVAGPQADDDCSFDAHARIRRSDYGLPHGFWLGGDEVEIDIRGAGLRAL